MGSRFSFLAIDIAKTIETHLLTPEPFKSPPFPLFYCVLLSKIGENSKKYRRMDSMSRTGMTSRLSFNKIGMSSRFLAFAHLCRMSTT